MTGFLQGTPDYFGLVDQVTSMVTAVVPPSKTVLVVSKGDDNLLQLGSRTGWHFPRTEDGRYAGHYPADSEDAVRQLEHLRERGAGYVVFPSTSLWWLDHYPELARHLDDRYTCLVRDDDSCAIYDLTQARAEPAAAGDASAPAAAGTANGEAVPPPPPDRRELQLRAFLDNLLPEHAKVLVASSGADLEGRREQGVEFLVVPTGAPVAWDHPELVEQIERGHRCIARQRYLCSVYDLAHPATAGRESPPPAQKTGGRSWLRRWRRGETEQG